MGAIVDRTQLDRVLGYIETGKSEGAGLHLGGNRVREDTGGYYVEPTIFDAVSNDMRIAQEEIFGPVLSAISFTDLDEAISDRERHDLRPLGGRSGRTTSTSPTARRAPSAPGSSG